jgi:dolichol-phosphate mannosyltransferase
LVNNLNIGIVTPMANEIDNAENFVRKVLSECEKFDFNRIEMYTILDRSCSDGTLDVLNKMSLHESRLKVIWDPDNKYIAGAYLKGYKTALECGNDWILEIDAGFSHDPEQIYLFFIEMLKGFDCVFGVRFGMDGASFSGSSKRKLISKLGTLATNALLGTRLPDMTSGFELFSSSSLEYILDQGVLSKGPFFQTEIKVHAHNLNFGKVAINYQSPSHKIKAMALRDAAKGLKRLFLNSGKKNNE